MDITRQSQFQMLEQTLRGAAERKRITDQAMRLKIKWAKRLQRANSMDATHADQVNEQQAYDELVDYVEVNGLTFSSFDPRFE